MMRLRWRIENWYVCGVCKDSIGKNGTTISGGLWMALRWTACNKLLYFWLF